MSKVKQVKDLKNGKGLQYLLDAAKRIFHNPLSIADMNHRGIAFTDDSVDDPVWNEMTSTATLSMKSRDFFAKQYFSGYIANADKYTILKSDKLKYARMSGYIFNRENVKVGIVLMYECYTPFDEDIRAAFELFTAKITCELLSSRYFIKAGKALYEEMIEGLPVRVVENRIYGTTRKNHNPKQA